MCNSLNKFKNRPSKAISLNNLKKKNKRITKYNKNSILDRDTV